MRGTAVTLIACLHVLGGATTALGQGAAIPLDRELLSGTIAGRACRDENADGRCSPEEPGYPGLRIVLESGAQVWTDEQGRYHFSAVPSRTFEARPFVHSRPGRHRVEVDVRSLLPGARVAPSAATVEVPLAGMVLQDFAVQEASQVLPPIVSARDAHPPMASRDAAGRTLFEISGRAAPADQVIVSGAPAEMDPDGTFRARVPLTAGENAVPIRVESPDGTVRLLVQRIHLVARPGGALIIPRELEPVAALRLPGTENAPARAGPGRVRVEAPAGTVIAHAGGELTVDASGKADVPVQLAPGKNVVSLQLRPPGQPPYDTRLEIVARARPFSVGLIDLEATFRPGTEGLLRSARLIGRGATSFEIPVGSWWVEGQLDVRDDDFPALRDSTAGVLLAPRNAFDLERALDPERIPWGIDESTELDPNPAQARIRLEAKHPDLGRLGLGTWRARFGDAEIGQYHRELFGAYASLGADPAKTKAGARVQAFGAPSVVDPLTGLSTLPAHAEFLPTGGSLFYLPFSAIARGSELVRVIVRDGITAVPLGERHLIRGVDYEIDYLSGRILLAQPLSMTLGQGILLSDPPTAGPEPVLVVDYERLVLGEAARATVGGEVEGWLGPLRMSAGAVQEGPASQRYRLFRGTASGSFLGLNLSTELARSEGAAHALGATTWSESGGLEFLTPAETPASDGSGWAWGLRLRGRTLGDGRVDASWRRRTPGYSDSTWDGRGALSQLSARIEQPIGPVVVGVLGDDVTAVDPRMPYGVRLFSARTLGGFAGIRGDGWEGRLELKDQALTEDAGGPDALEGGRTALGLVGRYRVHERVWLQAGHKQVVATRGEGLGALNDTFTSGGVEVELDPRTGFGVHGGWGPRLGPLVWAQANVTRGDDVYYGSYSVDVDGPDFGERRAVSGARTSIDEGTTVFVEDVGAHDATSVRLARAIGLSHAIAEGLSLSARYERGVRHPFDLPSALHRDAGSIGATWVRERLQLSARAELRSERGRFPSAPEVPVDREIWLISTAAGWDALDNLRFSGRLNASNTRFVEASAGLAWRLEQLLLVIHYGVEQGVSPVRPDAGERALQLLSIQPALRLGDRFGIAAGLHAGWSTVDGNDATVLSGSLRPSVRVVGGLELAAEVARRSTAPDEGELNALRGEVGYQFNENLKMAAGYTFLGYTGLGVAPQDEGDRDRLYLRAEAAW